MPEPPPGWEVNISEVYRIADDVELAGALALSVWELWRDDIFADQAKLGERDTLSSAFYAGYSHVRDVVVPQCEALPARFKERAVAAREAVRNYVLAEDVNTERFQR